MNRPETTGMTPGHLFEGEDPEETTLGLQLIGEAEEYLESFDWCREVLASWTGILIPPVLGVVLMEVDGSSDVDEWLWVIVGDLPSAYLEYDSSYAPSAVSALELYMALMDDWADAVESGNPLDDHFPVDAEPSMENARLLRLRLAFLRDRVLPTLSDASDMRSE